MRVGLYPGTFDPITVGHIGLIERVARLFDRLVIGVAASSAKTPLLALEDRLSLAQVETAPIARAAGIAIEVAPMTGLMVDFAQSHGATVVVRGLRGTTDFDYEYQMAGMNQVLAPGLETMFLMANPGQQHVSSTLVRQIALLGGDFSAFVSPATLACMRRRLRSDA